MAQRAGTKGIAAKFRARLEVAAATVTLAAGLAPAGWAAGAVEDANDWPLYHRSADGARHSPLKQITRENVKDLQVAWIHQPGAITHGLQATPIAIDGIVYYIASYNRVFAVDGATGEEIWHWYPDLDPIVEEIFFQPYSRGVTVGLGKVFVATLDGRGVALDQKTGEPVWEVQLTNPAECGGCNFTSPPVLAGDYNILTFGPTGGDLPSHGKIYGVKADTGELAWVFDTLRDHPDSWGDSRRIGGGGAWMTGSYDPITGTVFYGTGNPAPDFDWNARPGDNLYTSSVVALDPETGKLKWHFQEVPHDMWDWDAANGEMLFVTRDGKRSLVHANKGGFVFVYDPADGQVQNVWPLVENYNYVDGYDPNTGQMINRHEPKYGEENLVCPWVLGGKSWNHGSYSPETGLWYVPVLEACQTYTIEPTAPEDVPLSSVYFSAAPLAVDPPGGKAHGRLDARDPLTGERTWSVKYDVPVLSSVLTTAGGLVFIGDLHGYARAYDAESGQELWAFNTGSGIRSGLISYTVGGEQYVLVPSGIGSQAIGIMAALWPEIQEYPAGAALIAFKLGKN